MAEVKTLSTVAKTQPQTAHAAYTHGLAGKWTYLSRACEISSEQFSDLEEVIRLDFIPAISGHAVRDIERILLALPARMGGLGLPNPASDADVSYRWSRNATRALVDRMFRRNERPMSEVMEVQHDAFKANQRSKVRRLDELSVLTKEQLSPRMRRAVIAAEEKGSLSWLTALPLADFGFSLSKGEFHDALQLRYGWTPPRLPSLCVCGNSFGIDHALSCSHGGYLGIRHNEVRDLLGELLDKTCTIVCLEPVLKPIDGEQLRQSTNTADDARPDIKAGGFWSANRHDCAYFDMRVFYPHARSNHHRTLEQLYRAQEQDKHRDYEDRVRNVERGTFTPLVFSATEGAGPAATTFLKRLADKLSEKRNSSCSQTVGWLRCRLSFALLRASLLCLRGSRQLKALDKPELRQPDLAMVEACVSLAQKKIFTPAYTRHDHRIFWSFSVSSL